MVGDTRLFSFLKRNNCILFFVTILTLVLAVSFLFSGLDVFASNPAVGDSEWVMFRHDLQHTGTGLTSGPITNYTLWSYATGRYVYSSPCIVDGKVYVGSGDNYVY